MYRGWDVIITVLFLLIFMISSQYAVNSQDASLRGKRSVRYYHDSIIYTKSPKNYTLNNRTTKKNKSRKLRDNYRFPKVVKLLPADESLRSDYYSEKVENSLGDALIQRGRRDKKQLVKKNKASTPMTVVLTNTVRRPRNPSLPANPVLAARVQDIEEIFKILARRDGQFLEQMLSLKAAIDRLYSIFEYMGVANMPKPQREAAIRQVVRRAFKIDTRKRMKRKRRRKKFAVARA